MSQRSPCDDEDARTRNIAEYGYPDWYDWRCAKWGTKRDVQARLIYSNPDWAEFEFDSAWSPPRRWLEAVSRQYPKLLFQLKYEEPNNAFMGVAVSKNGRLREQTIEYSWMWRDDEAIGSDERSEESLARETP